MDETEKMILIREKIISLKRENEYPQRNKVDCNHKQCITRNYIHHATVVKSLQS